VALAGSHLPVTILTGALGSGKTTVLAHLLRQPALARTAVIINEFGEVGLDHLLVAHGDEYTVLLESGCVCCTLRSDLADTLHDLDARQAAGTLPPFERVVVETTGLADPGPIAHTLLTSPALASRFRLQRILTTIDAVNAPRELAHLDEARRQVALADELLLTKVDLVSPAARTLAIEAARAINPVAGLVELDHGRVDPGILDGGYHDLRAARAPLEHWLRTGALAQHEHAHHDHGRITSFAIVREAPLDLQQVLRALDRLTRDHGDRLLRVKGVLDCAGSQRPVVVHAIHHLLHPPMQLPGWPGSTRRTEIVFITDGLPRETVEQLFQGIQPVNQDSSHA
jgi:G3E family GTPase